MILWKVVGYNVADVFLSFQSQNDTMKSQATCAAVQNLYSFNPKMILWKASTAALIALRCFVVSIPKWYYEKFNAKFSTTHLTEFQSQNDTMKRLWMQENYKCTKCFNPKMILWKDFSFFFDLSAISSFNPKMILWKENLQLLIIPIM